MESVLVGVLAENTSNGIENITNYWQPNDSWSTQDKYAGNKLIASIKKAFSAQDERTLRNSLIASFYGKSRSEAFFVYEAMEAIKGGADDKEIEQLLSEILLMKTPDEITKLDAIFTEINSHPIAIYLTEIKSFPAELQHLFDCILDRIKTEELNRSYPAVKKHEQSFTKPIDLKGELRNGRGRSSEEFRAFLSWIDDRTTIKAKEGSSEYQRTLNAVLNSDEIWKLPKEMKTLLKWHGEYSELGRAERLEKDGRAFHKAVYDELDPPGIRDSTRVLKDDLARKLSIIKAFAGPGKNKRKAASMLAITALFFRFYWEYGEPGDADLIPEGLRLVRDGINRMIVENRNEDFRRAASLWQQLLERRNRPHVAS